jgi:DNA-binding GntR family transcriptional regulator
MLKSSLADKAHTQIKQWIIRYHLKPGALLNVGDLARSLSMSQTPVREALSMLEQEHMIERQPNVGYRIRTLNLQEIEDVYDLRIAFEVLAARQAAERMTASKRDRLSAILKEVAGLLKKGSRQRILELEQEFHLVLLDASGNRMLAEIGRAVLNRIWIIQNIQLLTPDHLSEAQAEHLGIFRAIETENASEAERLTHEHLLSAKEFVLLRLRNRDDILSKMMMGFPLSAETEERSPNVPSNKRTAG